MDEQDQLATASLASTQEDRIGEFRQGERIANRYIIVQFIARGGMGEVYEAIDEHLQGKRIAIKTLRSEIAADPEMQARFEREVLVAREVSHRTICPTWDLIRAQGPRGPVLCLSMKLLRGESLSARMRRTGPMLPDVALPIALQMASGLDAAHQAGVIHRDFKPGNVIVEGQGQSTTATITDFGLSRIYNSDVTIGRIGQVAGTPGYMAPELFMGRMASPASDVFAFGVVLHEMLAGQRAMEYGDVPDLSKLTAPDEWKRAIAGCLARDPRERFQSAGEAAALLARPGTKELSASAVQKPVRRRLIRSGLLAAGVALLAVLGWFVPRAEDILHPLPQRRFVALSVARDSASGQEALAGSILEGIHDRLVRSESRVKNLLIAGQAELAQQKEDPQAIGANLSLTVSLLAGGTAAGLRLIDLPSAKVLRKSNVAVDRTRSIGAIEAVATAAAKMLGIPPAPDALKDEEELAALPAGLYPIYTAAEELRRQPNDVGLDAAVEKYQQVLESAPRFALGYARIAQAYIRKYQLGRDPAVLAVAERNAEMAVRHNPESPSAVLSKGLLYLYSGRTNEALSAMQRVLQLDPGNPEVLLYMAAAYRDSNRLNEEEETYRLIIRERPNFYRAYNSLGMALYRGGHYQASVAAFQQATQIAPRQALPYNNLGMAYLLLGRKAEAATAFRASLERAPTELAWLNLGNLAFEESNYLKALEDYGKARDLKPSNDLAWRNIADCYAILGNRKAMLENYAKAAELLRGALRTNPKKGSTWMTMAFYEAKLGRRAEAEAALQKAEVNGASSLQNQFVRAQTLAVLGRRAEAADVLAECVRHGLSEVEIQLAIDLKSIREDPAWLRRTEGKGASGVSGTAATEKSAKEKERSK